MRSNAKMEKVPYSVMWISPRYYVHNGSIMNPLIPGAEKHSLWQFVVNQNYSVYIDQINL